MLPRHPANDSSKLHQFVSFDVWFMLLSEFKALFMKFAIAYAQIKIVMLVKIDLNCCA